MSTATATATTTLTTRNAPKSVIPTISLSDPTEHTPNAPPKPPKPKANKKPKPRRARLTPIKLTELTNRLFSDHLLSAPRGKIGPIPNTRRLRYSRLPPPCAEVDDAPKKRARRWALWDTVNPPLSKIALDGRLRHHLRRYPQHTLTTETLLIKGIRRTDIGKTATWGWSYPASPLVLEMSLQDVIEQCQISAQEVLSWNDDDATKHLSTMLHQINVQTASHAGHLAAQLQALTTLPSPTTPSTTAPSPIAMHSGTTSMNGVSDVVTRNASTSCAQSFLPVPQPTKSPSATPTTPPRRLPKRDPERKRQNEWVSKVERQRRWRAAMREFSREVQSYQEGAMLPKEKWKDGQGVWLPDFDYDEVTHFAEIFRQLRRSPDHVFSVMVPEGHSSLVPISADTSTQPVAHHLKPPWLGSSAGHVILSETSTNRVAGSDESKQDFGTEKPAKPPFALKRIHLKDTGEKSHVFTRTDGGISGNRKSASKRHHKSHVHVQKSTSTSGGMSAKPIKPRRLEVEVSSDTPIKPNDPNRSRSRSHSKSRKTVRRSGSDHSRQLRTAKVAG